MANAIWCSPKPHALSEVKANTVLFFQDDRGDALYVIAKGSVKVSVKSDDGNTKVLAVMQAGESFGEITLLDKRPRSATVETLQDSEFVSIGHHAFKEFSEKHPEVLWKVLTALCERVRVLSDKTLALAYEEVPYRLVKSLVELTEKAGGNGREAVVLHINARDLANLVGADRQAAARIIRQLEDQGLVRPQPTALEIPDPYALRRALEYARDWF